MDNNKLGLTIVRINQGYTDLLEINGDQAWTKDVWDIRKVLENVDNLDGSSAVLMLTCIETGHILTVASLIEGRITDCISAWMYVPASINISGKELVEIVDAVRKEVLANERNDEKLRQIFSKEYALAPATKMVGRSVGEKCAYRYYGKKAKYTLAELLNDLCQSYYKGYKSIFLLDNSTNLRCQSGDNLSDLKVISMVLVDPPREVDSFVPYIGEHPFVRQMYAIEGEVLNIQWRRDGYMPILTTSTIVPNGEYSVPTPNQYVRLLPYNYITVVDEWNQKITDYKLCVAKKHIAKGANIPISEASLNNVWVEINAEGFEPISEHINLMQPMQIKLKKETYFYEFKLPLKNDKYYPIKISGNWKIMSSPIEGYVLKKGDYDNEYYLRFEPFTRRFWNTCLICSIIVLLLGICCGYALNDFLGGKTDNKESSKLAQENYNKDPKGDTIDNNGNTIETAIAYLDQNNVWNRTEMEKYEALRGLWDAMNERRFDDILSYEKTIGKSSVFKDLVAAIKANRHKQFSGNGNYNISANDFDITIKPVGDKKGYIKALEDAGTIPKSKKPSVGEKNELKKNNKTNGQDSWK